MSVMRLIMTSILFFALTFMLQAADIMIPHQQQKHQPAPIIISSDFSWTGFYLGAQIGGFSSESAIRGRSNSNDLEWESLESQYLPKLSGVIGGVYAGSNIGFGNGLILGVDTDMMWSGKKDTKIISQHELSGKVEEEIEEREESRVGRERSVRVVRSVGNVQVRSIAKEGDDPVNASNTLKEKWVGATRLRIGFAVDHVMPYVSAGVAYAQLSDLLTIRNESKELPIINLIDDTKVFVGYTFGGGIDFAMAKSVILRAEYRYSDFGKKKFAKDRVEIGYKTNDFRVGVAYKF
ncbi:MULTISPECIES: outer membrane protein [unclassified Bartonella]|uniref:outer membrane protein n=1 Tax=unclassified Bartonella TaxID=2645622 RepID=UPI00099AA160|nr:MULTISPECIES: outer membrane protein [unclassified Bartonella]AQX27490.1 outer membrane immunogenic protein [Bartonella sp. JB15]AQX28771.1 outer membrane immunogenic protein [Bartonella sp. JB63]